MEQSSIEWLQEQLKKVLIDNQIQQTEYLFTQAKGMHKQEVIDAHDNGYIDGGNKKSTTAEQYYNETYNIKR